MKRVLKWTLGAVALCTIGQTAAAQAPDSAAMMAEQKAALSKLSFMDGEWRGIAVTQSPQGPHQVTQTERIGPLLGGTIKLLEGRGFNADGSVGFNAFGIVSYDSMKHAYDFRSYARGFAGNFKFTPTADGYVWEIPTGGATIRYTATVKGDAWREVGDRMVEGQPPRRFFEMNLKRIGDSAWPEKGALTPETTAALP